MKKIFTTLCLAAACSLGIQAQHLMRVSRVDGKVQYVPVTQIEKVDFVDEETWVDPTPGQNTVEDYFDITILR